MAGALSNTGERWLKVPMKVSRRSFCAAAAAGFLASAAHAQSSTRRPTLRNGSFKYVDPRLPAMLPERGWELYNKLGTRDRPRRDPKYNVEYPFSVGVNCLENVQDRETSGERRFEIFYQKKEDEAFARQVGSVMARLHWLGLDYLGVTAGQGGASVWLTHTGKPGGEEADGSLWLHAINEPRAPAEWVRELAHEYAHAVLPTLGPYSQPERWANGYLGERLFLKWMLHDNPQGDVWTEPIDGAAYVANQVAPLRELFLNEGPESPRAALTDADGMHFLIGQFMLLEWAHGPVLLKEVLRRIGSPSPKGLPVILAASIRALQPPTLPLNPRAFIPKSVVGAEAGSAGAARFQRAAYRTYLPSGEWLLTAEGDVPPDTNVSVDGKLLTRMPGGQGAAGVWNTLGAAEESGWRQIEIAAPAGKKAALTQLRLSRSGGSAG